MAKVGDVDIVPVRDVLFLDVDKDGAAILVNTHDGRTILLDLGKRAVECLTRSVTWLDVVAPVLEEREPLSETTMLLN